MNNEINYHQKYRKARSKSVGHAKKVKYVKVKTTALKRGALAIALATMIAISGIIYGGGKLIDTIQTTRIVYEATEYGRNIVLQNTKRTANKQFFYYEIDDIATELLKDPENFDRNLYGVYSSIGYNETSQKDQIEKVVESVGNIAKLHPELGIDSYENFSDYCRQKGFVKEDGSIDYEAYEKAMKELIVDEMNLQKLQEKVSEFKTR
jgi:hypothetical protein